MAWPGPVRAPCPAIDRLPPPARSSRPAQSSDGPAPLRARRVRNAWPGAKGAGPSHGRPGRPAGEATPRPAIPGHDPALGRLAWPGAHRPPPLPTGIGDQRPVRGEVFRSELRRPGRASVSGPVRLHSRGRVRDRAEMRLPRRQPSRLRRLPSAGSRPRTTLIRGPASATRAEADVACQQRQAPLPWRMRAPPAPPACHAGGGFGIAYPSRRHPRAEQGAHRPTRRAPRGRHAAARGARGKPRGDPVRDAPPDPYECPPPDTRFSGCLGCALSCSDGGSKGSNADLAVVRCTCSIG